MKQEKATYLICYIDKDIDIDITTIHSLASRSLYGTIPKAKSTMMQPTVKTNHIHIHTHPHTLSLSFSFWFSCFDIDLDDYLQISGYYLEVSIFKIFAKANFLTN